VKVCIYTRQQEKGQLHQCCTNKIFIDGMSVRSLVGEVFTSGVVAKIFADEVGGKVIVIASAIAFGKVIVGYIRCFIFKISNGDVVC
jgi:hypothetical protein